MTARARQTVGYLLSLIAGILAGAVFALLHTPIPVPPLIGLTGLLGIAVGESGMARVLASVRSTSANGRQSNRADRAARPGDG
ncbi:XapX domain-containing protein [Streptomyces sp. NPDC001351]|uniref:XapX domain-containing protein n=1 Tax=unclassified Streptomyces TaxID=2593676 RepID=UPI0036A95B46